MSSTVNSKPRASGFQKGKSGNPAGRKPGVPNKVTAEARDLVAKLMDESYFKDLAKRLKEKKLHPMIEKFLLEHRIGKPKDTVELTGADGEPIQVRQYFLPKNGREV